MSKTRKIAKESLLLGLAFLLLWIAVVVFDWIDGTVAIIIGSVAFTITGGRILGILFQTGK